MEINSPCTLTRSAAGLRGVWLKRREFLKTAAKAAWVAPALMTVSASAASAQSQSPAPGVGGTGSEDESQVLGARVTAEGSSLPSTGAGAGSLAAAGLASIAVGTAAVRVSRKLEK